MEGAQQASALRHVYPYKPMQRDILVVMGVVCVVAAFGAGAVAVLDSADGLLPLLLLGVILLGCAVYLFAQAFRSCLVIEGSRIEVRGAFGSRSADLSEVEGVRSLAAGISSTKHLILRNGRGIFSIPSSFETDDEFEMWLRQVPNLDERDQEVLLAKVEEQQEVGAKLAMWLAKLATAKRRTMGLLVLTLISAIGLNVVPADWTSPFLIVLILAPFVASSLCLQSSALYAIFKKKNDPRAETCYVLIVCGFGLIARLRGMHFVSIQPLILFMIFAGLAIALTNYQAAKAGANRGAFIAILFLAGVYGFGAVLAANMFLDGSKATRYSADVTGGHVSGGKTTNYYLRVSPWGPVKGEIDVNVPSQLYFASRPGDIICFDTHPGKLGGAWYRIVPCLDPEL